MTHCSLWCFQSNSSFLESAVYQHWHELVWAVGASCPKRGIRKDMDKSLHRYDCLQGIRFFSKSLHMGNTNYINQQALFTRKPLQSLQVSPDLTLSSSFQWTQNFQTGHGQASRKLTMAKLIWAAILTFLRTCCPLMPISATDQYHSRLKEAKKGKSNYCKTETGNRTIIKNSIEAYQTVSKSFSKHPQQLNFSFIAFPQEIQFHDMENSYCKMPRDTDTNTFQRLTSKGLKP